MLTRVVWCAIALLAVLGVGAAVGRSVFVADFTTRAGPVRRQLLEALQRDDPRASQRPVEFERFDKPFAAHPVLTLLHVVPGALLLILAPLQFSSRVRARHLAFHRWSGRGLVLVGFLSGVTALYFGVLMPFGGARETIAVTLFGGLFLVALGRAFFAIRQRQVARHREWMIRAFAIAIGISTVRIVGFVVDVAFAPAGLRAEDVFVFSIWAGWGMTLGAAEMWIRYTRISRQVSECW